MIRFAVLFVSALALTLSAFAQTKMSGSFDCDKADPMHMIPIPDREGYAFSISQHKCAWTKPVVMEGLEGTVFVNTVSYEMTGATVRTTAWGVTTYDGGVKGFTRSSGTSDRKALTSSGKWTIAGGTGKLRGFKGGGTYTCKMKSDEAGAGYTCEVAGEYTPPAAKK
jgi:hypothetical protein